VIGWAARAYVAHLALESVRMGCTALADDLPGVQAALERLAVTSRLDDGVRHYFVVGGGHVAILPTVRVFPQ
jgi:hypothetical protein